jgi:hypothetical protein
MGFGDALQVDGPWLRYRKVAEPLDRRGADQDLAAAGQMADPGGGMHALARVLAGGLERLGSMHADPNLGSEALGAPVLRQATLDVDRARDGRSRVRERDEESVARVVDLLAAVALEAGSQGPVVPATKIVPRLVVHRFEQARSSVSRLCTPGLNRDGC